MTRSVSLLLSLPASMWAGSLLVTVQDPYGAAVQSVSVLVSVGNFNLTAVTNNSGQALFSDVPVGRASLHVEEAGFKPFDAALILSVGKSEFGVHLAIAPQKEVISVSEDAREAATDPHASSLGEITQQEIEAFSDDPHEFLNELKDFIGSNAVIRIDGFLSSDVPPTSEIQSIRLRSTPYSAEESDDGFIGVEIIRKHPASVWAAQLLYAYRNGALYARNVFAPQREPTGASRVDFAASGPLRKDKASLSLTYTERNAYNSMVLRLYFSRQAHFTKRCGCPREVGRRVDVLIRISESLIGCGLSFSTQSKTPQIWGLPTCRRGFTRIHYGRIFSVSPKADSSATTL